MKLVVSAVLCVGTLAVVGTVFALAQNGVLFDGEYAGAKQEKSKSLGASLPQSQVQPDKDMDAVAGATNHGDEQTNTPDAVAGATDHDDDQDEHDTDLDFDDDEHGAPPAQTIGADGALQKALAHAQKNSADIHSVYTKGEWEHKKYQFEVRFVSGDMEYEYDIDGVSGEVIEHEIEPVHD